MAYCFESFMTIAYIVIVTRSFYMNFLTEMLSALLSITSAQNVNVETPSIEDDEAQLSIIPKSETYEIFGASSELEASRKMISSYAFYY